MPIDVLKSARDFFKDLCFLSLSIITAVPTLLEKVISVYFIFSNPDESLLLKKSKGLFKGDTLAPGVLQDLKFMLLVDNFQSDIL